MNSSSKQNKQKVCRAKKKRIGKKWIYINL